MAVRSPRKASLRKVSVSLAAGALALCAARPAAAWTRSYALEWFEPAHYFAVPEGVTSGDAPGEDCPQGAVPANDWLSMLTTPYRSREEVLELLDPEQATKMDRGERYAAFATRGPNKEDVLTHPEAIPDPGMLEVQGRIAYGFNLDGDERTGFTGPDGERGIDNAFYQASGCVSYWRGQPRDAAGFKYANDGMRDGSFTVLLVLSGQQDPMNDPAAKLGIYVSRDKLVKDASSGIAADYSYRVSAESTDQTVLDVRIRNGVVETTGPARIRMHDWKGAAPLVLEQARLRFELRQDGTLYGLLGGYREWYEHYRTWARPGRRGGGVVVEHVAKINMPAWWYAMRRRADGLPDPKTGENKGISGAYRVYAVPAFVIAPDAPERVTEARYFAPGGSVDGEPRTARAGGSGDE